MATRLSVLSLHTGAWNKPATPGLPTRLTVNRTLFSCVRSLRRSRFGKLRLQPLRRPSSAFRSATSAGEQATSEESAGTHHTRTTVDDAVLIQGMFCVPTSRAEIGTSSLHPKLLMTSWVQALAGPAVISRIGTTRSSSKYLNLRYAGIVTSLLRCMLSTSAKCDTGGGVHTHLASSSQSVSLQTGVTIATCWPAVTAAHQ